MNGGRSPADPAPGADPAGPPGAPGSIRVLSGLREVAAADWDRLAMVDSAAQPFVGHAYLSLLEETGCVGPDTGWQPCHLTLWRGERLAGALPLYLKGHSWGEYVFDWAWAEAYARAGLDYYPKLVAAVPFTPVAGPRLLAEDQTAAEALAQAALAFARRHRVSSFHCLFPRAQDLAAWRRPGLMERSGLQFHWRNAGYASFENFLARLDHAHRKKIRQERRKVRDAGIRFQRLSGSEAGEADWAFFHRCYRETYRRHRSTPYLDLAFFMGLGARLPDRVVLIQALREGRPVAAALNLNDGERLYGRWWGALEFHPGLHFETCYYQAIEHAIATGLQVFEGGAQGEHKLARGLTAVPTHSVHWLAHPEFARAVGDYLDREAEGIARYADELNERGPYKDGS
jgi:uncharacterized protein